MNVMCRAHRDDDCPNGPESHEYYNPQGPVGTWSHVACCAQPSHCRECGGDYTRNDKYVPHKDWCLHRPGARD